MPINMKTRSDRKLRKRAEERLRQTGAPTSEQYSPEAAARHFHELQVHQIELEIQNEELLRTQGELTELLNETKEQLRMLDQKNLVDALRESEAKFRLLAENTNDNIWTMDLDGRLTFVSQSIYKIRGFTSAEALAQPMEEVVAPDSLATAFEALGQISTNVRLGLPIENVRLELELLCKGGSTVWTEVNLNGMYDRDGAFVQLVGVTRDITERKQADIELSTLLDKLEQSLAAEQNARTEQGRFIAMLSHEYRTPLAIIRGNLDLIELTESRKTGGYNSELGKMKRAVNRLVELMDISLARSRITDYHRSVVPHTIQAAPFMDSLLEYTRNLHTEYEYIYAEEPDSSITFNGEAEYLKTALLNLLDNATKYSIPDTPITISCRVESGELVICVHNHGFGLTPAEEEWLFEKYRRGRGSRNTSGAGLGLWLVRDIITQHGGSITLKGVKSEVIATVRLPLALGIDSNYDI